MSDWPFHWSLVRLEAGRRGCEPEFLLYELLQDARAEVAKQRGQVAALREALAFSRSVWRSDEIPECDCSSCSAIQIALSDTAAAASAHDAKVRADRDEEYRQSFGLRWANGSPMLQSQMTPEIAKSTLDAMREADEAHDAKVREPLEREICSLRAALEEVGFTGALREGVYDEMQAHSNRLAAALTSIILGIKDVISDDDAARKKTEDA